jgi:hypothetical protein
MEIQDLEFRYKTDAKKNFHHELLDYFNSGEYKKYFENSNLSSVNTGISSEKIFTIKMSGCGMANLSKIFAPDNKFLPHEVSCDKDHCYPQIRLILKSQRGNKARLKRGLLDILDNKARIKA